MSPLPQPVSPAADDRSPAQTYWRVGLTAQDEAELVRRHMPMLVKLVQRFCPVLPEATSADDWINLSALALIHSARSYDPARGVAFEHYARICIRSAIFDEIRRLAPVSRKAYRLRREIEDAIWQLSQAKGEEPTEADVARHLRIPLDEYLRRLDQIRTISFQSIDELASGGHEGGPAEPVDANSLDPSELAAHRDYCRHLAERLKALPQAQQRVMTLFYYEGLRLKDIGELLGLTEARISQLHTQAIASLRAHLRRTRHDAS